MESGQGAWNAPLAGVLGVIAVLALAVPAGAAGSGAEAGSFNLDGICFSPYMSGQSPDWTGPLPEEQIQARLALVAPHADWIRSYGTENGLEAIGRLAHGMGKKVAVGAWISGDRAANERQLANLIAVGRAGEADVLVVGSEVMLRGDLPEAELIGYIERVRAAVPGVPVTTGETFDRYLAHPALFDAVDTVYAHVYAYWMGAAIQDAVPATADAYRQVRAQAGPREVVIAEAGWPSAGEPNGGAVPSVENAERFIAEFTAWAQREGVRYFLFSAYDEGYKITREGERGRHWGIYTEDGRPKYDLATGGAEQRIWFVGIPPVGVDGTSVSGATAGAVPGRESVALYIRVDGGVWNKPTFAQPLTPLSPDGTWSAAFVTGGNDRAATEFAAYLLPPGVVPPELHGAPDFPEGLAQYPHAIQARPGGGTGTYQDARNQYVAAARAWGLAWGSGDVAAIRQYLQQARSAFATCLATAATVTDSENGPNLAVVSSIAEAYVALADAALAMYEGADAFGTGQGRMSAGDYPAAASLFGSAAEKFSSSRTLFSGATTTLQGVSYAGTEYGDGAAYTAAIVPLLNGKASFVGDYARYAQGWQHTALAYGARGAGDDATFRSEVSQGMAAFDALRSTPGFGPDAAANYGVLAGLLG